MNDQQFRAMAADPAAFQGALLIDTPRGKRPFGEVMADFQRERFAAINPALLAVARGEKPAIGRFWWEATKGASKDSDLAVCLLWLAAFCSRLLTIQVGAVDQDQADELRKAARKIIHDNPWLGELVEIQTMAILSKRPGGGPRVDIIAADAPGSHGARPDVMVVNELTHHKNREFAETLMDNASKVPNGLVVIATNAGHVNTWQEEWRTIALEDPSRWAMHVYDQPAPWLDEREIAAARKRNSRERFARLWGGQWVSATGQGIPPTDIDAAIRPKLKPVKRAKPGWIFVAGLDLSTSRDTTGLVVIAKHVGCNQVIEKAIQREPEPRAFAAMRELDMLPARPEIEETVISIAGTGKLRLACVRHWIPTPGKKLKLSHVEAAVLEIHERLGLSAVAFDPWEAALMAERLENAGLNMVQTNFSGSNLVAMASAMLEEFADNNVELFPHEQLIADLRRMSIVEKSYGMRLAANRSNTEGHADLGTALALAVLASREFKQPLGDELLDDDDGPLIWN